MGKIMATEDGAKARVQRAAVAKDRAVACLAGERKDCLIMSTVSFVPR